MLVERALTGWQMTEVLGAALHATTKLVEHANAELGPQALVEVRVRETGASVVIEVKTAGPCLPSSPPRLGWGTRSGAYQEAPGRVMWAEIPAPSWQRPSPFPRQRAAEAPDLDLMHRVRSGLRNL